MTIQGAVYQRGDKCAECGSGNLIHDYKRSEIVCRDCGLVNKQNIPDRGPEWRVFNDEQIAKRERVGAPMTHRIHDKGLSTFIDWHDRDVYGSHILKGKELEDGQKSQIHRLRKWQKKIRVQDASERNLSQALTEISKTGNALGLPKNILETGSVIYRKAIKEHVTRGRSIPGMANASLYVACKQCGVIRTIEEFVQASGVDKKTFTRDYRTLIKRLDYFIPPPKNSQYVTKFSNNLHVSGKTEEIAHKIIRTAKEKGLTIGRDPVGVAASALYIASVLGGEKKTQREIAEATGVTEVTIRNRYKEMRDRLQFIISL